MPLNITEAELQAVADALFAFAEQHEGAAARGFTEGVKLAVDRAGLPLLYDYLKQRGIVA